MLVRVIDMGRVDVANIQFDFDLVFSVMFMNGHGRIYSRYGGRTPWNAESRVSLDGLKYTMQQVLEVHQPDLHPTKPPVEPRLVRDLPGLGGSCIHCHQVWEGLRRRERQLGTFQPDSLYVYPRPENVGLRLDLDEGNRVVAVQRDSPAALAGLMPEDELRRVGETDIYSQADVSWALHQAPDVGDVAFRYSRKGMQQTVTLKLEKYWKETKLDWRASMRREEAPERHK